MIEQPMSKRASILAFACFYIFVTFILFLFVDAVIFKFNWVIDIPIPLYNAWLITSQVCFALFFMTYYTAVYQKKVPGRILKIHCYVMWFLLLPEIFLIVVVWYANVLMNDSIPIGQ
jgi:hypothetical protein